MKKSNIIVSLFVALLAVAVTFTACQKSSSNTNGGDTSAQDAEDLQSSATADAETDGVYNDVLANVLGVNDDAGIGGGIGVFLTSHNSQGAPVNQFGDGADSVGHCFNVTISPETAGVFPKTITVDFGSGCTGRDGHTRRGKIITVYTGRMRTSGSTATTSFDGFYLDSLKVEGSFSIQNKSTADGFVFTVSITNGKITATSGNYIAINRTHTWTQTAGNTTPHILLDDAYSITGNSSGTAQKGAKTIQWTTDITKPVVRSFTCFWAVSGQITITRNTKTGILDYGDGGCDNSATLTVGAKVYTITLH